MGNVVFGVAFGRDAGTGVGSIVSEVALGSGAALPLPPLLPLQLSLLFQQPLPAFPSCDFASDVLALLAFLPFCVASHSTFATPLSS